MNNEDDRLGGARHAAPGARNVTVQELNKAVANEIFGLDVESWERHLPGCGDDEVVWACSEHRRDVNFLPRNAR